MEDTELVAVNGAGNSGVPSYAPVSNAIMGIQDRETASPVHLVDYWRILIKRWGIVISVLLIVLFVAAVGTWKQTPVYRASLKLQIDPEQPSILPITNLPTYVGYVSPEVVFQTQLEALTSNTLASRVIRAMKLDQDPRFTRNSQPSVLEAARARVLGLFSRPESRKSQREIRPDVAGKKSNISPLAPALASSITVTPVKDSRVIYVGCDSTDPTLAAAILNTMAAEYIQMNFEIRYEAATSASDFFSKQLIDLKAQVERSEEQLVQFGRQHNISNMGDKENVSTQKLVELNTAMTRAQADRIQKESLWKTVQQMPANEFPDILRTNEIRAVESNVAQLKQQKARLLVQFKPGWPEVKQVESQLAEAEKQLATEHETAVKQIQSEYQAFLEREKMLEAAVAAQKAEVNSLNEGSIQYNIIKREVDSSKQLYDGLLLRTKEAAVAAGLKSNNIHIVDPAEVPGAPYTPNKPANMAKALGLGLLLGIALAFFLEYLQSYFDRSIKTPADIEQFTSLPFLGLIPSLRTIGVSKRHKQIKPVLRLKLASGGKVVHIARESKPVELITFRDSRSVLAEAFRDLRTSVLLSSSAERAPKSLLVTSSHKGEGKTTTAINLAITLAQAGEKVLLFDCDMRNPSIARALGLDNSVGISTVLSGTAVDSSPLIQYTMVPNLFLCAAGQIPPNPAELIGSVRLRHCLKAFSNTYDHVIIDSPPLLSVTDARILATMVDGVILVIRGGDTTKEAVERSRRLLVDVRARIMGTMLNNVDLHSAYPYYSRYHYDRYGYGYGYGQK